MLQDLTAKAQEDLFLDLNALDSAELRIRDDRQAVFQMVRDLAHAQFELADPELINRLWREVFDRGMDIDRIINLMYGCSFYDNDELMLEVDTSYQGKYESHYLR